jgi:uncharacterized membrane protein
MAGLVEQSELKSRGLDRIMGLSDGIFAFSITLMVLDLAVPAMNPSQGASLLSLLAGEWLSFMNYFLSFAIIAIWWNAHHRNFEYINGYDGTLKAVNLLVLLSITLVPFFTKLLDSWSAAPQATALYAIDQGFAGLFLALTWWHATRNNRFIDPTLEPKIIRRITVTSVITPMVFFASIPLCLVNSVWGSFSWYSLFPIIILIRRHYRRPA